MKTSTRQILALAFGLALVISAGTAAFYWVFYKGPVEVVDRGGGAAVRTADGVLKLGKKVLDDLSERTQFRPRLVIGEKTVIESRQQLAELAAAARTYTQTHRWEHSFLGSTKRIEISGDFIAKAGYKLQSPMELRFSDDGGVLTLVLPEAAVLSNEMTRYRIIEDKDGIWNEIKEKDREEAVNALKRSADRFAAESGLTGAADESMMSQIRNAVNRASELPIEIRRIEAGLP